MRTNSFIVNVIAAAMLLIVLPACTHTAKLRPPSGEVTNASNKAQRAPGSLDFSSADAANPPPPGGVLFIGSSTTARWKLAEVFPGHVLINRGVGGTQMADMARHYDQIVAPYAPRVLVVYQGDNDLASGKTPQEVVNDAHFLAWKVFDSFSECQIVFLAVKPSPRRASLWPSMVEVNVLLSDFCGLDERMHFVNFNESLLTMEGEADPAVFASDRLHLNEEGYERWSEQIDAVLRRIDPQWAKEAEVAVERAASRLDAE